MLASYFFMQTYIKNSILCNFIFISKFNLELHSAFDAVQQAFTFGQASGIENNFLRWQCVEKRSVGIIFVHWLTKIFKKGA